MLHDRNHRYVAAAALLRRPWLRATVTAGAVAGLVVPLVAFSASGQGSQQDQSFPAWVGTWAASPMDGTTDVFNPTTCRSEPGQFTNQTVRNIVYTSVGGDRVRVRLSNAFGTEPLTIGDASVAVAETGAETVPGTMRQLQFNGQPSVTIPAGSEAVSTSKTTSTRFSAAAGTRWSSCRRTASCWSTPSCRTTAPR